jgi:hypothetical protein
MLLVPDNYAAHPHSDYLKGIYPWYSQMNMGIKQHLKILYCAKLVNYNP